MPATFSPVRANVSNIAVIHCMSLEPGVSNYVAQEIYPHNSPTVQFDTPPPQCSAQVQKNSEFLFSFRFNFSHSIWFSPFDSLAWER